VSSEAKPTSTGLGMLPPTMLIAYLNVFFRTIFKNKGTFYRIYCIKKHWIILQKVKTNLCFGPVLGSMEYATEILKLYKTISCAISTVAFAVTI